MKLLRIYAEDGKRIVDIKGSDAAVAAANAAIQEEDLRLLYGALTQAEHALWLGATSLTAKVVSQSALNYLIRGRARQTQRSSGLRKLLEEQPLSLPAEPAGRTAA